MARLLRTWMAALLALAATPGLLCTGCSHVSTGSRPFEGTSTIHGVVRYAIANDINTMNPVLGGLAAENAMEEAVFDGLIKLDDRERVIPDLATEVPSLENGGISADGRTIVYHLRRGVRWQDGAPLTSADVVFTFQKIVDPKVNAPNSEVYVHVESVKAPNPLTVVVRLKAPWAPAVGQLFCNGENGSIIPKHLLERSTDFNQDPFGTHPVGSGPLELAAWERGAQITLVANPSYFGGEPKIRKVQIVIVPDANTRLTALRAHSLDFAPMGNPAQVNTLRSLPGLRVRLVENYDIVFIAWNVTRAPFDDVRVRRALAQAIDRPRLTANTYLDTALPADSLIPPFSWAYEPSNGSPTYNPAAAARLLSSAGWLLHPDGARWKAGRKLSFELLAPTGSATAMLLAEQIQAAWQKVGADAILRTEPLNVLRSPTGLLVTGNYDAAISAFIFDPDPDRTDILGSESIGARGYNEPRYASPLSDELGRQAVATYDKKKRKPVYAQLQRLWNTDLPFVPIAWIDDIDVVNTALSSFRPEPVNSNFWNVQDWQI